MAAEKPYIHLFNTTNGYYMYDVGKNSIIRVHKHVYEALAAGQSGEMHESPDQQVKNQIEGLKEKGFLSSKKASEVIHPANSMLEYYLDRCVEKITLQVTQMCNLRCRYCPYSGYSDSANRKHTDKVMSFEIAKRSIDFLLNHSQDIERINIGFYGGEPLLEFDLIKKGVEYAKESAEGKKIYFSMTSNGTLLNDGIIDFLVENDFSLTISLDGPREIHNRSRRYASNGSGSFDTIIENAERIKKKYPEYFKSISFNIVLDPKNDLGCVNDFFMNFDAIKEARLGATMINDKDFREKSEITEAFKTGQDYERFKVYLYLLEKLDRDNISAVSLEQYKNTMKPLRALHPTNGMPDRIHHGGPCVPGCMRLFIDVNGNFFPCERVNETSEMMKIGNLDTGFDVERIRTLMNIGKLTEEECKNCWAFRYCSLCASYADNFKDLSAELKLSNCKRIRYSTESLFKEYVTLKEFCYKAGINLSLE